MFKNGVALAADRNMCCERLDVHDGFLQVRPEWKLSDRGMLVQKIWTAAERCRICESNGEYYALYSVP